MLCLVRCIAALSWVTFARLLSSSFSVIAGARALVQEAGVVPRSDEDDDGFFSTDDESGQVERSVAPVLFRTVSVSQDEPVSEAVFQVWVHLRAGVCPPPWVLKGVEKEGR